MEFPEISLNDSVGLKRAKFQIDTIFSKKQFPLSKMIEIGNRLRDDYLRLEPILKGFTEKFCANCKNPCCVNRHGFPDFEDLVVQRCLGIKTRAYEKGLKDTSTCQFLGPEGCVLDRIERSYRCTWYFCDKVMDEFQRKAPYEFLSFEKVMSDLTQDRQKILKIFKIQWEQSFCKRMQKK